MRSSDNEHMAMNDGMGLGHGLPGILFWIVVILSIFVLLAWMSMK